MGMKPLTHWSLLSSGGAEAKGRRRVPQGRSAGFSDRRFTTTVSRWPRSACANRHRRNRGAATIWGRGGCASRVLVSAHRRGGLTAGAITLVSTLLRQPRGFEGFLAPRKGLELRDLPIP